MCESSVFGTQTTVDDFWLESVRGWVRTFFFVHEKIDKIKLFAPQSFFGCLWLSRTAFRTHMGVVHFTFFFPAILFACNNIYIYINIMLYIMKTLHRGKRRFFDLCWVFRSRNSPTSSTKVQESLLRCKPGRGRSRRTNLMIWVGNGWKISYYYSLWYMNIIISHISIFLKLSNMAIEYNRITRNWLAIFWWTQDP